MEKVAGWVGLDLGGFFWQRPDVEQYPIFEEEEEGKKKRRG